MSDSTLLKLPYLSPSQSQKHVTHNEALRRLDAVVQLSVQSKTLTDPPAEPADGDRYILPYGPTGDWSGHQYEVAAWIDGAWMFFEPKDGWTAWVYDEALETVFYDSVWRSTCQAGGDPLLLNGSFIINQRAFPGGTLSAGSYGHDRWKAGSDSAEYTVSGGIVTLQSGRLEQTIESDRLPAGGTVSIAADNPSAVLTVDFDGWYATINAGAGRQFTMITLPPSLPNPSTFAVYASEPVSFSNLSVNAGSVPASWVAPDEAAELARCQRYFISGEAGLRGRSLTGPLGGVISFPTRMRTIPAVSKTEDILTAGTDPASFAASHISENGFFWEIDTDPSGSVQEVSCLFRFEANAEL